ncbi:dynein regulatory complex protein 9-like [Anopheles ziemanni]|uniref:dynein regulatory complex protein 9-like n=1 Tax=Anopheles coustani TaxID=139045 RepID=UPI002659C433|nr:dynein regulatory complex protein 9-like [Anopheles coustani]XP_058169618.1 dynein regulatory complex protein 9-like [Anopheles ziemanni]
MTESIETCRRTFTKTAIQEALRKLEVLSWCQQNSQLFDSTKTYSIAELLYVKKRELHEILSDIIGSSDEPLSTESICSDKAGDFRVSSSSGEARVYYDRVEYLERCKEIHRLMKKLKVLKYQFHEQNQKLHLESQIEMAKQRFIKSWESSRKEQLQHTISDRVDHLEKVLTASALDKTHTIVASAAIEKFYRWKLESTEQEIEDWMNRFDREKEEQDSRFQKVRATEKHWNELHLNYEERQHEIESLEKELISWEAQMQHKELCGRMATKLQAWWRGVMVRKRLGRFGPMGGKKAKGKHKGKGKHKK